MARARDSPTPATSSRSSIVAAHDLLEAAEAPHDALDHRLGQPGDAGQEAVPPGLHVGVEIDHRARQVEGLGHTPEIEKLLGTHVGEGGHGLFDLPLRLGIEVVEDHEAAVVVYAPHQLLELELDQPPVDAELHDVAGDLVGDAPDHLGALQDVDDVTDGDEVLDLEGGERSRDAVEPLPIALERLQRLVGPGQEAGDVLERMLLVVDVDRDDRHVLRHRDDGDVDGAGDALGRAVPGTGLGRRHVGVGHEVDVGAGDAARVAGQDDGAVHLGELRQPLRTEGGVEQEPARADVEDLGTVAHDDERALVGLEDAVESLTQRGPRSDGRKCGHELRAGPGNHVANATALAGSPLRTAGRTVERGFVRTPRAGGRVSWPGAMTNGPARVRGMTNGFRAPLPRAPGHVRHCRGCRRATAAPASPG